MIDIIDYCKCGDFKTSTENFNRNVIHVSGKTSRPVVGNQTVFTVNSFVKPLGLDCSFSDSRSAIAGLILRVRQNYNALSDICCLINSMHGYTLVVNWLVATVCLSVDVYYVTVSFVFPSMSIKVSSSAVMNITLILWILFTLVRMFVIAVSCQWVSDEHRKCISNVQRLLLKYSTEEDVLTQLVSFTDQLVYNKIEFTACGIFTVNVSVLCTVAGLVIQYITLLCQMKEPSKP
jgi:gustatory receptor